MEDNKKRFFNESVLNDVLTCEIMRPFLRTMRELRVIRTDEEYFDIECNLARYWNEDEGFFSDEDRSAPFYYDDDYDDNRLKTDRKTHRDKKRERARRNNNR